VDMDILPACSQGEGSWVLTLIFKNFFLRWQSNYLHFIQLIGGFTVKYLIPFIQPQNSSLSHYLLYTDMKTSLLLLLVFASLDLALWISYWELQILWEQKLI